MFIFSVKSLKSKIIFSIIIVLGMSLIFFVSNYRNNKNYANGPSGKYSVCAKGNDERLKFLGQFGWQVREEPLEIAEVTVPAAFNDTYKNYNEIQKKQGLDLSKFSGKTCTRITYQVLNYKGANSGVRANLLILNDKVIGGDVCSVELKGFMHGFVPPNEGAVNLNVEKEEGVKVNKNCDFKSREGKIESTYNPGLTPDQKMPSAPMD